MALLEVKGLVTEFPTRKGIVRAVDGVTFSIEQGEILAVVGESGSGKSVTSLSIMGLLQEPGHVTGGSIVFDGKDLLAASEREMESIRGDQISMIFQEPMTSLNPVYRVGDQIVEAIQTHTSMNKKDAWARAVEMLRVVGIPSPEERAHDFPHQMSGGMRQRVMIAMALACDPKLLIADEPTTALDVSIQAQVLNLLDDLKDQLGLTYLFIAHGLNVVKHISDRVGVMYLGRLMEIASKNALYHEPLCPYTQALLSAIPSPDPHLQRRRIILEGDVPSPIDPPAGCRFAGRCFAKVGACDVGAPELAEVLPDHWCACHRYANISGDEARKVAREIQYDAARPSYGRGSSETNADPVVVPDSAA